MEFCKPGFPGFFVPFLILYRASRSHGLRTGWLLLGSATWSGLQKHGLKKKISTIEVHGVQTGVPYQSGHPIPRRKETIFFPAAILFLGTPHPALPHKGGGKGFGNARLKKMHAFIPGRFVRSSYCRSKKTVMIRVTLPPPLWGRAGWGVSPAGRGYLGRHLARQSPFLKSLPRSSQYRRCPW